MQKLIEGMHRFRLEEFGRYQELFHRLSREGQNPHTLFITCSDSRVLAELITQSQPGDLFVVKNVGNIVPPAGSGAHSTAAAIEFAIETLGVRDIVVCGHSLCGAMEALLKGLPNADQMPHLSEWLTLAAPVKRCMKEHYPHLSSEKEAVNIAAKENILFALDNLHSYPPVSTRLETGTLQIHGWFFNIATAEISAYDPASQQFHLIRER